MNPAVIAAIVTGIAGLFQGIFNAVQTNKTNQQSMDFSRESAATQQQYSKELLDYNSPSHLLGQINSAGLNPNLAYDAISQQAVPTGAHADLPSLKPPQLNNIGVDDALKIAQINRLNAASTNETELTASEIAKNYKSLGLMESTMSQLDAHASYLNQSILESQARVRVLSEEQRSKALEVAFKSETFSNNVKLIANQLKISNAEAENIMRYINAKVFGLNSQAQLYLSQIRVNDEYKETLEALGRLYTADADLVTSQTTGQNLRNTMDSYSVSVGNQSLYHGSPYSIGQWNAKQTYQQNVIKTSFVTEQNRLLHKFGGVERTANVINTYSQALESTCNSISTLMPFFGRQTTTKQLYGSGTKSVTSFGF